MAEAVPQSLVIIQARLTSQRFPKKVLARIWGQSLLDHMVIRAQKVPNSTCVVALPKEDRSQRFISWARRHNVDIHFGSNNDVLKRFVETSAAYSNDIVVRLTADCPMVDPELVTRLIVCLDSLKLDYINNSEIPTFPHGLDAEAFRLDVLHEADRQATSAYDREHVTLSIRRGQHLKKGCLMVWPHEGEGAVSPFIDWRWTVDYRDDLRFLRSLWEARYTSLAKVRNDSRRHDNVSDMRWWTWIPTLLQNPKLMAINVGLRASRSLTSLASVRDWHRTYAIDGSLYQRINAWLGETN